MRDLPVNKSMLRDVLIAVIVTVVMALAVTMAHGAPGSADQGRVRMRDAAVVEGDVVTLGHVARLDGAAAGFADVQVAAIRHLPATVTHDDVRRALDAHNVHWGRITLAGFAACRIERPVAITEKAPAPVASNLAEEVGVDSAATVKEQIVALIERFGGVSRDRLEIRFDDRDTPVLANSTLVDRYELEPTCAVAVGRVPIVVRRYEGDRLVETWRIDAFVSRRVVAAVMVRGVTRGQVFTTGDVELGEVLIDDSRAPVTDLAQVIGQTSAAVLREGAVVLPQHLRSPLMVRKGELVTVRCFSGALVIKTVARAVQDGAMGEQIQARNEKSRQTFTVKVTGKQEAVMTAAADEADDQ